MRLFQESSEPSSPHAPKDNADTRPRRGPTRPDEPSASPREGLEDSRRYLQVIRLTATVVALALPLYCYPTASSPGSEAAPRGRRLGRVRPLRRRPTSSTRPTRRWRRPCAARARDPRRSVLARRRDRRTPGSVPALIGQSAARHHGRVAGEPDQASGACFGAGSTRGTGSHETGGGVGGSQPSGDGRPIVTVMRAGSWRSLTQQRPPDGPAQSPDLERLRQHACLDDRPPLTPAPPLTTTLGRDTRPVRGGLDDELQCRSRASRPGRVRPVRQRPTSEARSVELGHLQVRHDQVVPPPSKQPPGLGPIAGRVHVMTGRPEARYHQVPGALIVVDDEDAPGGDTLVRQETHRASPRSSRRGCIEGARPMGLRRCELRPPRLDARPLGDSGVGRNYPRPWGPGESARRFGDLTGTRLARTLGGYLRRGPLARRPLCWFRGRYPR